MIRKTWKVQTPSRNTQSRGSQERAPSQQVIFRGVSLSTFVKHCIPLTRSHRSLQLHMTRRARPLNETWNFCAPKQSQKLRTKMFLSTDHLQKTKVKRASILTISNLALQTSSLIICDLNPKSLGPKHRKSRMLRSLQLTQSQNHTRRRTKKS